MKILLQLVLVLSISASAKAAGAPTPVEMEENAYVRLYSEWVELDRNDLLRFEAIAINEALRYKIGQELVAKNNMSLEEFTARETRYKLSLLTVERQKIKIRESQARLSVVKGRVGAGLTDIPICSRPSDASDR